MLHTGSQLYILGNILKDAQIRYTHDVQPFPLSNRPEHQKFCLYHTIDLSQL